jgi:hypothetical protein
MSATKSSERSMGNGDDFATRGDIEQLREELTLIRKALEKLVAVEINQNHQGARIGQLEITVAKQQEAHNALDRMVDRWVTRGIAVWAFVGGLLGLVATLKNIAPGLFTN